MSMIERVARAIAEADGGAGAPILPEDRKLARAALEAMRNPPRHVLDAAGDVLHDVSWHEMGDAWREAE